MNIYKSLNLVVDYIEQHLYDDIENKKLTMLTGINYYSLNNAFSLISGFTLKDYIRNRRLSNSIIHLKDKSLTTVALMCGYTNPTAYSRAFKRFHGYNPSEVKNKQNFKFFYKLVFKERDENVKTINIQSKQLPALTLFADCIECKANEHEKIESFWQKHKAKYPILTKEPRCALTQWKSGTLKYFLASKKRYSKSNVKITLPAGEYLCVLLNSIKAEDISKISASVEFEYQKNPLQYNIEMYENNHVELLYKV